MCPMRMTVFIFLPRPLARRCQTLPAVSFFRAALTSGATRKAVSAGDLLSDSSGKSLRSMAVNPDRNRLSDEFVALVALLLAFHQNHRQCSSTLATSDIGVVPAFQLVAIEILFEFPELDIEPDFLEASTAFPRHRSRRPGSIRWRHEAFLRRGHECVNLPLVKADRRAAGGTDRIDNRQDAVFLCNGSNALDVVEAGRRRFVMTYGNRPDIWPGLERFFHILQAQWL